MSLYNKYRPKKFSQLIGPAKRAGTTICKLIADGAPPRALFFYGESGCGKTTLAQIIAATMNCEALQEHEPCGTCASCESIFVDKDYVLIDGSFDTSVDNIRGVVADAQLPLIGVNWNVIILDEMHNLSKTAQDAMLTVVENPPPNVIFIFCTTLRKKINKTLLNRCLEFHFKVPSTADIKNLLVSICQKEQKGPEIVKTLGNTFDSVRGAISRLEVALTGGDATVEKEKREFPIPLQVTQMIKNGRRPSKATLAQWIDEMRTNADTSRIMILESLNSKFIKCLKESGSASDLTRLKRAIDIMSRHEVNSIPVFLTIDLFEVFSSQT